MRKKRRLLELAKKYLPSKFIEYAMRVEGRSGEGIFYDEADLWKRILNYRIAKYLQPRVILETHKGLGLSTYLYRLASPNAKIISLSRWEKYTNSIPDNYVELLDIDPFGQPYKCLFAYFSKLRRDGVLLITNGEIYQVVRGLRNVQFLKTDYKGRDAWRWVVEQYLPWLEEYTGMKVRFFYVYPTSVRVVLSSRPLPKHLFEGCPVWMGWLAKYAYRHYVSLDKFFA